MRQTAFRVQHPELFHRNVTIEIWGSFLGAGNQGMPTEKTTSATPGDSAAKGKTEFKIFKIWLI